MSLLEENTGSLPEGEKPKDPEVISIGPSAYLRSMFTIFWTAIRHPFTTTCIDLSTGKEVKPEENSAEESQE